MLLDVSKALRSRCARHALAASALALAAFASADLAAQDLADPAQRQDFATVERPLYGYAIRGSASEGYELVRARKAPARGFETLHRDDLYAACHRRMIEALRERFGPGKLNVTVPTFGGKQIWSDEFVHAQWRIQRNVLTRHHRLLDAGNVRRAWGSYDACRVCFERERVVRRLGHGSRHAVVLLHGMGRSRAAFKGLARTLRADGFEPVAVGYPSTRRPVREHAAQVARVLDRSAGFERVSFVTHSMGGLVARELLALKAPWRKRIRAGRLVMLGPPNQGAYLADRLEQLLPYRLLAGKGGRDLVTKRVQRMHVPKIPFAIIAGGRGDGKGYNPLIEGDDDGVVAVETTKLRGATDFLRVPTIHTLLMRNEQSIAAIRRFLAKGRLRAKR